MSLHAFRAGGLPRLGAGLVLWAGSEGRGQRGGGSRPARGMASLCGRDTGWPWGGKVTGHCERPHHEGEKYCSLDLSFCHSPTWPGVYVHEGKVGCLFHDKGDISVQFNRDEYHPPKPKLVPQSPDGDCQVLAAWTASSQGQVQSLFIVLLLKVRE